MSTFVDAMCEVQLRLNKLFFYLLMQVNHTNLVPKIVHKRSTWFEWEG